MGNLEEERVRRNKIIEDQLNQCKEVEFKTPVILDDKINSLIDIVKGFVESRSHDGFNDIDCYLNYHGDMITCHCGVKDTMEALEKLKNNELEK